MGRPLRTTMTLAGIGGLLTGIWRLWARCCDPDVGAWDASPAWASSGHMTNVAALNAFVEDHGPCWQHHPVSAALAILGVDPTSDAPTTPAQVERAPGAGSGEVDVRVVYEEADDSMAATRSRFTFVDEGYTGGEAGVLRLIEGMREFRCQPGRGHEDWGTTPCV